MSNDNLGVLSILSTAYDRRKETVNEVLAAGDLDFLETQKTASAQQSPQNTSPDAEYYTKLAQACYVAAEGEESAAFTRAQQQKVAEAKKGKGQPASSIGPNDNEVRTVSEGHVDIPTASKVTSENGPLVNEGQNRPENNKKRPGLQITETSNGLDKASSALFLQKAAQYFVPLGTNAAAKGQPASSVGPRDNETGTISSNVSGGRLNGSPMHVARLTAQELEADAQSSLFPFSEPQAHEITAESGRGAGPHTSAKDGPFPNKTASAQFLKQAASAFGGSRE